jgi:N-acetylglucosaminyldiphosphoundecaprenol N-acetyl-beta-D-mannosaminyltransferase
MSSEEGRAMVIGVREVGWPPAVPAGLSEAAELRAVADAPLLLRQCLDLFGVLIDHVDSRAAVERIHRFLEVGGSHQVVTVNLDFLYLAERDPDFRVTINQADLAVPDGMPLVWLSHALGTPLKGRVTGVELVHESCQIAAEAGIGVFFLGGTPEVATLAATRAQERYDGLRVSAYSPPFGPISPEEDERIVEAIIRAQPGFLFVALGAPRQDLWIREHRERLGVPVSMGVGCVLDLMAGTVHRAPAWMQSLGFEWSYRLMREPRRLWRRYLRDDLPHFWRLFFTALGRQRALSGEVGRTTDRGLA